MTLKQLQAQQQKEVDEYWRSREKRLSVLDKDQREIMCHCMVGNDKTTELLKGMLTKQRATWEEMERDDLDMLLHIQQLEKESFLKKEAKRLELQAMLTGSDKAKSRGR